MSEYIEREAAIRALLNDAPEQVGYSREDAADCIRYMDAADVAPVRHARWEKVAWWQHQNRYECNECSVCGCRVKPKFTYNYCPHCGADMRGSNDE